MIFTISRLNQNLLQGWTCKNCSPKEQHPNKEIEDKIMQLVKSPKVSDLKFLSIFGEFKNLKPTKENLTSLLKSLNR